MKQELIAKAKSAKAVEELLALAKENRIELTAAEANTYFAQLNPQMGELADDELDNVSGGGCNGAEAEGIPAQSAQFHPGQLVYLRNSGHTFGSRFCRNSVCASEVFRIVKQIEGTDTFLIECRCGWTYHAVKENIVCVYKTM